MFFNKRILKALLWKHWIVRKRTWLVSSVELLLPLAMFLGMFALRKEIGFKTQSSSVKSVDTGILRSDPLRLSEAAVPECILFTPDNKLNRDIIVIVAKKLNRVELDDPPDDKEECHGYYIFNHTSEVSNFTESERMRANDAIVVFEAVDFDTSSMPPNMSYTIRMKKPFMTHLDSALDDSLAPHQSFSTIYESFMRLQWAIDTSFIELLTGKEVKQRVTLQEFPFVKSNNDMSAILVLLISCSVLLTMIGPFMFMTGRMALERISGIREIMKMSGASGMLLNCLHLLDYLPMMLMFAISGAILLKVGDPPLLPKSNGFLLFLIFLLHAISLMTFGMIVSYVIRSEQYANMWSLGAYLFICCCLDSATSFIPNEGQPYLALVPLCPMKWVMTEITQLERYGVGATFNTITSAHTITNISICYALWSMFAQIVFYMALAWYLEHVYPGKYGIRLPWNFLCQKQYWRANDVAPGRPSPDEEPMKSRRDKRFFEKPPANAYAGLKAVNVTKIYRSYPALNDVSLQVYRGELTVLLGHNGAGKTTLMSIMTGTINPTSGKLYVNGTDIKTKDVRSHIGFCPQHNLYYPALNVVEHAVLFAMIRGQSKEEAWAKSGPLLEKLGLKAKATALGATLSGGMKRRLQMACALAGDVDVLVLDEPSSGLDVETRRHLWDLLLSLRANRTVLLSTHFMEEADALGDRIAALNAGELKCYGTPMFLKRAVGTGYRLSLTTSGQPDEAAIKSVVQSVVPEATVAQNEVGTIAFALPATSSDRFPQLFAKLEEQKATLGVLSIGVGVTTLEDVFVAVCSDVDTKTNADEVDGMARSEPKYEKLTGFPLCCSQFAQLLKREALFIYHKKFTFLFLQVLSSVLLLWVIATRFNNENLQSSSDRRRILEAGAYSREATPSGELRVLYRGEDSVLPTLRARYPMVQFESSGDVAETILRIGQNSLMEYHKYLAGLEVNETDAKVMYSTLVRHAAPTALSLLANVLAAAMGPAATLRAAAMPLLPDRPLPHLLLTSVEPVTLTQDRANEPKDLVYSIVVCFFIFFGTLWQSLNAVALPAMSRITGARHLHIAAGCSAELHWLVGLLFRLLVLFVTWFLPLLIIFACDPDDTYNNFTFMWATFWLMVIGSASFITLGYWISLVLSDSYTQLLLFILIIASFLLMIAASFVSWIIYLVPSCTFLAAMIRLGNLAFLNAHFAIAGRDTSYCAICFGEYGIGIHLLWLILYTCMFLGIVFASQRGVWSQMLTRKGRPHELRYGDEAVRREQDYVADTITLETKRIPDAMLVSKIQKQYRKITPVKNISFSVKKGECLGLLGVNGAGKTTTFNMLTAEQWPSLGRLFAGGHHREGYTLHYMRALGYCPQFFGLDGFLTGKQNLELLLRFRGLGVRDARQEAAAWIRIVGLEKYTNQKVEQYSGGCQRRISAAAALEIGAPLTVLDEPTSGVDVAARRRVWAALRRGLRSQRAVIITSHSMDEMEALCNRIAIMGGGEICALGAPAALRAAHAAGHAVVVKLRPPPSALEAPDQPDGAVPENAELNKLKEKFEKTFNATLKDEHLTMLHYHINETMEYSKLFSEMEKLKKKFPNYVEDYSVAETTLEEVFLGFAKKTADDAQATADALKAKKEAELAARRPKKQTQTDGKNSKKDNGSPKHNV